MCENNSGNGIGMENQQIGMEKQQYIRCKMTAYHRGHKPVTAETMLEFDSVDVKIFPKV